MMVAAYVTADAAPAVDDEGELGANSEDSQGIVGGLEALDDQEGEESYRRRHHFQHHRNHFHHHRRPHHHLGRDFRFRRATIEDVEAQQQSQDDQEAEASNYHSRHHGYRRHHHHRHHDRRHHGYHGHY